MSAQKQNLLLKFYSLGALLLILAYGKVLWPVVFGKMREQDITFSMRCLMAQFTPMPSLYLL
jgi:hypothetical protein